MSLLQSKKADRGEFGEASGEVWLVPCVCVGVWVRTARQFREGKSAGHDTTGCGRADEKNFFFLNVGVREQLRAGVENGAINPGSKRY